MDKVTSDYLDLAQSLIDDLPSGEYELSEIFGEHWKNLPGKKAFGKNFKREVKSKRIHNIMYVRTDEGSNHRFYQILGAKRV